MTATPSRLVGSRGERLYLPPAAPRAALNGGNGAYYATPSNTGQADYFRPRPRPALGVNNSGGMSEWDWSGILSYSRQIFGQMGLIGSAIIQKNNYAVGDSWIPQYYGEDKAFGSAAEEWLAEQFYPVADVRGPSFDFVTNLFLAGVSLDVDGDVLMVLTEAESGFPQVKFYAADRIGSRDFSSNAKVKEGQYKGRHISRGVIFNEEGRAIAYNILGDKPEEDLIVSAFDAMMVFEPEWQWQGRGIPRVARGLLDAFNLQDIDTYLMRGVKLDSSQGLIHYTESGQAPTMSDILAARGTTTDSDGATVSADGVPQDIQIEKREGGEIMYMRAGVGERVEPFKSDRPHPNTEAFIARIERRALLSLGWFYELVDPSKIGGASVRLIQDQSRASVKHRQKAIRKMATRAVQYAVAKAMKKKLIPSTNEWWKFEFETPALLTVDAGYDRQADRDDLKLGLTTKAAISAKQGRYYEDVTRQRKREVESLLADAAEVALKHNIPVPLAIDLLEQRSSSPVTYLPFVQEKPETPLE